jgi:hypothetical protein
MIDPTAGPYLFDTSAAPSCTPMQWSGYAIARHHEVNISPVMVIERVRSDALLWRRATADRRSSIESCATGIFKAWGKWSRRNIRLIHNKAANFKPIRVAIERAPARFHRLGPLELIRCTSLAMQ